MNKWNLSIEQLKKTAMQIRKDVLVMNNNAGQGHTGADLSETDILTALYFKVLSIDPQHPDNPDRDRFILSKGHGVGGLYCTLAKAGFLGKEELKTYLAFDSHLPGHPVRQKTPGIEHNTGALGHGLAVSIGCALAGRMKNKKYRVFVLTGDGELQEGSVWEAAMAASRFKLDNLTVIVDRNRLQLAGETETIMPLEPLADKWRAFGFDVVEIDGNNMEEILGALDNSGYSSGKPRVIIARTVKGRGVSFIENNIPWHHKVPTESELIDALKELEG